MSDSDDYGYLSNNNIEKAKASDTKKKKLENKTKKTSVTHSDNGKRNFSQSSVNSQHTTDDDDKNWMQF